MHRFFVPASNFDVGEVSLPSHTAQQVQRVLRLKPGDEIAVFDGSGREWPATLASVGKSAVTAVIGDPIEPGVESSVAVTMLMAPIRHERYELALQKATELGASAVVPVITERVLGHEAKVSASRFERWERILTEAAEQSGRVKVPELREPSSLIDAVQREASEGPVLLLWEEERSRGLAKTLKDLLAKGPVRRLAIVIGPIGGLTADEVDAAKSAGAIPVALGKRILRAETAAIAALSIVMSELGDLGA